MTRDADSEVTAFLDRMAKRVKENPEASRRGNHRVAFLALRPLVEGALARGYTVRATWEALRDEGKLTMTYETFRGYCQDSGFAPNGRRSARPPRGSAQTLSGSVAAQRKVQTLPELQYDEQPRRFQHSRIPNKKEIYG